MHPSTSTAIATSIQGNTISGISPEHECDRESPQDRPFIGISVGATAGSFNIVTGNTIGSLDGSSGIVS